MNYTEIAQRFYQEKGRAMTWIEALKLGNDNFTNQTIAELYAESVRLEERRKVIEAVNDLIYQWQEDVSNINTNTRDSLLLKLESLKSK